MRKILLAAVLLLLLVPALGGCQERETEKAFVAPYDMSQDQQELLSLLGLEDAALVFSFQAPEEAAKVTAHTYVLEDGVWVENGGVSLLREGEDSQPLAGEFALVYHQDRSMDLHLNAQGRVSFSSDPVPFEGELLSAAREAIPESQPAPLGEEVPVALFLEDGGTSMKSLTPQSYFTPQELEGMDVAQAVTLEFSAG